MPSPSVDPGYFEGVKKFLHVGTVQKELVDPYCLVNFAGHKGKTQVIWNEQDPEWNHQINLPIRVRRQHSDCSMHIIMYIPVFSPGLLVEGHMLFILLCVVGWT